MFIHHKIRNLAVLSALIVSTHVSLGDSNSVSWCYAGLSFLRSGSCLAADASAAVWRGSQPQPSSGEGRNSKKGNWCAEAADPGVPVYQRTWEKRESSCKADLFRLLRKQAHVQQTPVVSCWWYLPGAVHSTNLLVTWNTSSVSRQYHLFTVFLKKAVPARSITGLWRMMPYPIWLIKCLEGTIMKPMRQRPKSIKWGRERCSHLDHQ